RGGSLLFLLLFLGLQGFERGLHALFVAGDDVLAETDLWLLRRRLIRAGGRRGLFGFGHRGQVDHRSAALGRLARGAVLARVLGTRFAATARGTAAAPQDADLAGLGPEGSAAQGT